LDHFDFARDHALDAAEELRAGGPALQARPRQPIASSGDPRIHDDRLAQRLAGDRPRVDAHTAHAPTLLDDRGALAELGRLHGRPLTRGPAADTHEIEVEDLAHDGAPFPRTWRSSEMRFGMLIVIILSPRSRLNEGGDGLRVGIGHRREADACEGSGAVLIAPEHL